MYNNQLLTKLNEYVLILLKKIHLNIVTAKDAEATMKEKEVLQTQGSARENVKENPE